jgi:hypothetical protein
VTLHSIFIFLQSGENLISRISPVVRLDQTLLTGLLTAIREFGHEAIAEEVRTIGAGAYRFHYDVLGNLITVGLADGNADELEVQAVLHSLNVLFFNKFERALRNWDGGVRLFQPFVQTIDDALRAYNESSQVAKRRISSTEYLLSTFGEVLDVILVNLLVGNAIIVGGGDKKITQVSEALNHILPFSVPNMQGIADVETAQSILDSRKQQRRRHPTLLGVSEKVYRGLTTPEHLEHHLFINVTQDTPVYLAPLHQPSMDIAKRAIAASSDGSTQAKLLELQLESLSAQLNSFVSFRQSAPNLTLEDLRTLLHFDSERLRLLAFLAQESVLSPGVAAEQAGAPTPTLAAPEQPSEELAEEDEPGSDPAQAKKRTRTK